MVFQMWSNLHPYTAVAQSQARADVQYNQLQAAATAVRVVEVRYVLEPMC